MRGVPGSVCQYGAASSRGFVDAEARNCSVGGWHEEVSGIRPWIVGLEHPTCSPWELVVGDPTGEAHSPASYVLSDPAALPDCPGAAVVQLVVGRHREAPGRSSDWVILVYQVPEDFYSAH